VLYQLSYISQKLETLERETGIEPATNSLEGCDSTTELLPPCFQLLFARTSTLNLLFQQGPAFVDPSTERKQNQDAQSYAANTEIE
jgi:hypothetical protein